MAQNIIYENNMQSTVNFSTVANGELFIYTEKLCVKFDNNNPNYAIIGTGEKGRLANNDQVLLPKKAIIRIQ